MVTYTYDASGNRITKLVTPATGAAKLTVYVRDASGNVMSVYENVTPTGAAGGFTQTEAHLYGSSRLGVDNVNRDVATLLTFDINTYNTTFERGNKFFELSNHLGNVLVTVSDRVVQVQSTTNSTQVGYYLADVITANDYYPFGMNMPGRTYSAGSSYRYGFNGKETSPEISNGAVSFEARIYDSRIGRFFSTDPRESEYGWQSTYVYFSNCPTSVLDVLGMGDGDPGKGFSENDRKVGEEVSVTATRKKVFRADPSVLIKQLENKDISAWKDLLNYRIRCEAMNLFTSRNSSAVYPLLIGNGYSDRTNFDYFSVDIRALPIYANTPKEFFDYLRKNFGDFFSNKTSMAAYNDVEKKNWESDNPLGTMMSFDEKMFGTTVDASVLTTGYYEGESGYYWNFSTMYTFFGDGAHPVSGTRQFGLSIHEDKNGAPFYRFFVRAVDRVSNLRTMAAGFFSRSGVFGSAKITWEDLMKNIATHVNGKGGTAIVNESVSKRLSWKNDVKRHFTGERYYNETGRCNPDW